MVELLLLILICVLQFVLKIPYFNLPLDRDYGAHGYIAHNWMKGNGCLYRDMFCSKTPGLKIIYMIIIKWFGISRKSFRLFFALYNIATTIAIYALGVVLFSSWVGLLAAFLYAIYSSIPSLWWHFSNTEEYYILFSVLSFLCIALGYSSHSVLSLFIIAGSGLLGGISLMFKQPSLINTIFPVLIILLINAPNSILTDVVLYAAGFIIPLFVFFLYFSIIKKTPWDNLPFSFKSLLIIKNYLSKPLYKANRGIIESNRRKFRVIYSDIILLFVTSLAGAAGLWNSGLSNSSLLIPWILFSIIGAIVSRTYLPYHFIPMIAPMCIMGGEVIHSLMEKFVNSSSTQAFSANDFIALSAIIVLLAVTIYNLTRDLLMPKAYMGAFYSGDDQLYDICEQAGKYIKDNTNENDFVYSWGHEEEIYLWSERRASVSCIYPPIINPDAFKREQVVTEFSQLLSNKPKYIAVTSGFGPFKEFENFIIMNYVLEKKYEPFVYLFKAKSF